MALAFFFIATSWFEPVRSDFDTAAAYDAYRRQLQTHPLSAERLAAIATRMEKGAAGFARVEPQRLERSGPRLRRRGMTSAWGYQWGYKVLANGRILGRSPMNNMPEVRSPSTPPILPH